MPQHGTRGWVGPLLHAAVVIALSLAATGCGQKAGPAVRQDGSGLPVTFPESFRLGVATVAYQSEGTIQKGGKRVDSNWSEWEDLGKIEDGQHNDRGNGFFDHWDVDLDLARGIGANAFSYAIDWARIEPKEGVFDEDEVARAVDIVKGMKQRGLRPLVVLFHWVTPAWVQSPKSGVDLLARSDRAFVDAFLPVVDKMVPKLAGMVDDWVTFPRASLERVAVPTGPAGGTAERSPRRNLGLRADASAPAAGPRSARRRAEPRPRPPLSEAGGRACSGASCAECRVAPPRASAVRARGAWPSR